MWTLKQLSFIFFEFLEYSTNSKNFFSSTPNLFSFFPVEIWLNVFASVLGFNLIPIFIILFFDFATLSISIISLLDSAFNNNIF